MSFHPDYHNLEDAAFNREAKRLPLYEHIIDTSVMGAVLGEDLGFLYRTDHAGYYRFLSIA